MFLNLLNLYLFLSSTIFAKEIAISFDEAPTEDSALMTGIERTNKIIKIFA